MPRTSFQVWALEQLLSTYHDADLLFILDNKHQIANGNLDDDLFHENNDLFVLVAGLHGHVHEIQQNRNFGARSRRTGSMNVFKKDLAADNGIDSWMSNNEFLCKYRVTCDQLDKITNFIADNPFFS